MTGGDFSPASAPAAADAEKRATHSVRRVLLASLIGTTIEFFDFYIYATAAVLVFPRLFFPAGDATSARLQSLATLDRKSTRLNSSHDQISYAVFCLKKKNKHSNIRSCITIQIGPEGRITTMEPIVKMLRSQRATLRSALSVAE